MIKEGIEKIQQLVRAADGPFQVEAEPSHVYWLRGPGGELIKQEADGEPRSYELFTLADLAKAVNTFGNILEEGNRSVAFCGRGQIRVCIDENGFDRDTLRMELATSHEFDTLTRAASARAGLDQKKFVGMLRIDLNGAVIPDDLQAFRQVTFKQLSTAAGKVGPGSEGFGKDVQREALLGGQPPPDEITMRVCVYRDLVGDDWKQAVRCAVDLNLETLLFTLIPLAGELERAQRETDALITKQLKALLTVPAEVFCGNPRR